jgi:long-chain acyl-CoA synthetase
MFHIADAIVCMTSASTAGTNYFQPSFVPTATMQGIADYQIQRLLLVPTMINMLVNAPNVGDYDLTSVRAVMYGASPMPEPVIRKAMEVLPTTSFTQAYGQTEAAPVITILSPERHVFEGALAGKIKSAGQAVPLLDLMIIDEQHQPVATGIVGEISVRGPNVMLGYRNMQAVHGRWRLP